MAKHFSDREKHIIRFICNHRDDPSFVLVNVFNQWFNNTGVSFDVETGDVVYGYGDFSEVNVNKILSDENGIIEIALLIKYLEDNNYIYLVRKAKEDLPKKPKGNWAKLTIANELPQDIAELIRHTFRRVYVSYDLVHFVDNGFKTYEEAQLENAAEQLKTSNISLLASKENVDVAKQLVNTTQEQLKELRKQTIKVKEQADEAKDQTKEVQKQTKYSRTTLCISIAAIFVSIILPFMLPRCTGEKDYQEDMQKSLHYTNTIIVNSTDSICNKLDSLYLKSDSLYKQTKKGHCKYIKNRKCNKN